MRARRPLTGRNVGLRRGGGLLAVAVAVAAVALIGSAQAASTKPYTANVHQTFNTSGTPGSFTLTLTNDPKAQQGLGSANFTPPTGFTVSTASHVTNSGFNVSVVGNVVQFRATSSQTALGKGGTVSADVVTSVAACSSATWGVEAKQSNDFSGQPGNNLTLAAAGSDLTPLGSFVVAPIETVISSVDPPLHVPQIVTNATQGVSVTAKDTCGNVKSDYSGAGLAEVHSPPRLAGAGLPGSLSWSGGAGSASFKPVNVEVLDQLLVTDPVTGIKGPSNSFDVVETICAVAGTTCTWQNKNKTISATSTVPGNGQALGLGFSSLGNDVTCTPPGGTALSPKGEAIEIDPVSYTGPYTITLVYAKSVSGTGSTPFVTCLSKDNGVSWFAVPDCGSTVPVNTAPCVQSQKRVTGGALQIVLFLEQGDPGSAGFG